MTKTLIAISGPTGVGKSAVALEVAERLGTEIISADSRQIYRDIPITTAAPTREQLARVRHHLVGVLPLESYYSASLFERDALASLDSIFSTRDVAVACGGSMMYMDALCHGLDPLPTISAPVREQVAEMAASMTPPQLLEQLARLDPLHARRVDPANVKRIAHAIEICLQSGRPYSELRTGTRRERPFRIMRICLTAEREILFERINRRAEQMLAAGMEQEARSVYHLRHLNSLNTVGFKEMFRYITGEWDLDTALARLQKNTRVYAKKQLTWAARDNTLTMLDIGNMSSARDAADALFARLENFE